MFGFCKEQKIISLMKKILFLLFISVSLNSCYYDNVDELHPAIAPCDTSGTVSFSGDILPIMIHSCGGENLACHQTDVSQSGYGLGTFADVISTIDNSGTFLESIVHSPTINSSKWMPKNSSAKLDNCSIQKIEAWLNRGKANNWKLRIE